MRMSLKRSESASTRLMITPFDLDENASDDGVVYGWRVLWNEEAPPGVDANGTSGLLWSDIPAAPDEPDEDDS